jgi:hypothetical protein
MMLYEFTKAHEQGEEFFRIEELPDRRLLRVSTYTRDGAATTLDIDRQHFEKGMAVSLMAEMEFLRRQVQAHKDNYQRLLAATEESNDVA